MAAQQGHFETCAFLLQAGSDVSHHDLYGRNASTVALNCGHTEIVNLIADFVAAESSEPGKNHNDNQTASKNGQLDRLAPLSGDVSGSVKLSKYDARFYSAQDAAASNSNSVPNKNGGSRKSKKARSISKLTKILH